ncbi:MAG: IPT/TIG domain-containing protein [Trueperaceae bacterium]|nr:IPT/TIG domain-containing protein [Trueperaceae bacterium]
MKRLAFIFLVLMALGLVACAPTAAVSQNVIPTLISVTVPTTGSGNVVLQGRYFGDGSGGASENSYVIVGANMSGDGGVRVEASSWSANRIEFVAPAGAGSGFVFVVVDGVTSNGLPVNLQ